MSHAKEELTGSLLVFSGLADPADAYRQVKQHIPGATIQFVDQPLAGQIAHMGIAITDIQAKSGSDEAAREFGLKPGDLLVCETWSDRISRDKLYENELAEAIESAGLSRPASLGGAQIGCMAAAFPDIAGLLRSEDTFAVMMGWPENTGLDPALYVEATPRIVSGPADMPDELLYHAAFSFQGQSGHTGRLLIAEVWTSKSAQQRFMQQKAGLVMESLGIPEPPLELTGRATGLCLPENTAYDINA
jgi:hypothetical protein